MSAPEQIDSVLARFAPVGAAIVLIALFTALGFWQLDRAAQKAELRRLFDDDAGTVTLTDGLEPRQFQHIEARGRYLPDRQFLIDNIVRDTRLGYYVITPFETAQGEPLLLVNRGWLARPRHGADKPGLAASADYRAIRGRAGRLPRVGIR
ncbi:MAG: SURF1 family protein, partial [Woeseiaceae bacterium]